MEGLLWKFLLSKWVFGKITLRTPSENTYQALHQIFFPGPKCVMCLLEKHLSYASSKSSPSASTYLQKSFSRFESTKGDAKSTQFALQCQKYSVSDTTNQIYGTDTSASVSIHPSIQLLINETKKKSLLQLHIKINSIKIAHFISLKK